MNHIVEDDEQVVQRLQAAEIEDSFDLLLPGINLRIIKEHSYESDSWKY